MLDFLWYIFQKQPSAAEYKKTDEPQPDVNEEEKMEDKDKGEAKEEEEEAKEEKPGIHSTRYWLLLKTLVFLSFKMGKPNTSREWGGE